MVQLLRGGVAMEYEDRYLVHRTLEGDTDAFGKLVESYEGAVFATAFYYAGRHGAAEDISQEAFLEAYRCLRRLKDPGQFGPWLKELTCRTAANWVRKHGKRIRFETPIPYRRTVSFEDAREGADKLMERHETYAAVRKALDSLPARYRLPLVLRYLQEASYDEIAKFTGQTREEIRGLLQRGGVLLRETLVTLGGEKGDGGTQWHRAHE